MGTHELNQVRDITLALPEVNEKPSPGGAIENSVNWNLISKF